MFGRIRSVDCGNLPNPRAGFILNGSPFREAVLQGMGEGSKVKYASGYNPVAGALRAGIIME